MAVTAVAPTESSSSARAASRTTSEAWSKTILGGIGRHHRGGNQVQVMKGFLLMRPPVTLSTFATVTQRPQVGAACFGLVISDELAPILHTTIRTTANFRRGGIIHHAPCLPWTATRKTCISQKSVRTVCVLQRVWVQR